MAKHRASLALMPAVTALLTAALSQRRRERPVRLPGTPAPWPDERAPRRARSFGLGSRWVPDRFAEGAASDQPSIPVGFHEKGLSVGKALGSLAPAHFDDARPPAAP